MGLLALRVIANAPNGIATGSEMTEPLYGQIDDSTGTASQCAGAVIAAISRIKVKEGRLLNVVGRDKFGTRLQLNTKVISQDRLRVLVEELLATWK